jgi:hypothetical protein
MATATWPGGAAATGSGDGEGEGEREAPASSSMAGDLAAGGGGRGFGDISGMREWGMRPNLLWPSRPAARGSSSPDLPCL